MDEEYKGFTITIEQDEYTEDPRKEWDHVGTMVCFHNRYDLGDKHNYSDPEDALREILEIEWDYDDDYEINELWDKLEKVAYVLPLFLYDHSGITMNTGGFSCPWDSGQVGFYRSQFGRKHVQETVGALLDAAAVFRGRQPQW